MVEANIVGPGMADYAFGSNPPYALLISVLMFFRASMGGIDALKAAWGKRVPGI
jgi:hypothetical protein